jgi:G3E family GTPase
MGNTVKKTNKIPVILITGYLGSGKTTLLNELLRRETRKIALIVNDMGSINVDAEILKKNGAAVAQAQMVEMQNGCICCTLRDEFIRQIEKLSKKNSVDAVFVEASGISDPGAIAAAFLDYTENEETNVYLNSIVTVVDGDRIYREFLSDLQNYDEAADNNETDPEITTLIVDQMEFCNFIVLNKCDLLTKEQVAEVRKIIRTFQHKAEIIESVDGKVDPEHILSDTEFDYDSVDSSSAIQKAYNSLTDRDRTCTDEYGISSFVFENRAPFNREKFLAFLHNDYPENLIRAKGYLWFSDSDKDMQLFEQAGRNCSLSEISFWVAALDKDDQQNVLENNPDIQEKWDEKYGDRMDQLVFIGKKYDEKKIRSQLTACLEVLSA